MNTEHYIGEHYIGEHSVNTPQSLVRHGDPQEDWQTAAPAAQPQQDPREAGAVSAVLRQVHPLLPSEAGHEEGRLLPGGPDDDPGQAQTSHRPQAESPQDQRQTVSAHRWPRSTPGKHWPEPWADHQSDSRGGVRQRVRKINSFLQSQSSVKDPPPRQNSQEVGLNLPSGGKT